MVPEGALTVPYTYIRFVYLVKHAVNKTGAIRRVQNISSLIIAEFADLLSEKRVNYLIYFYLYLMVLF